MAGENFINDVTGHWAMNHDGWAGTLVINPSDQHSNEIDGPCAYHPWVIDGTWSGGERNGLAVSGSVGGQDTNRRTGESCPESAHRIAFTIAFPDAAPQPFEGYVFTHSPTIMAGYTWWSNQPYAWYAQKQ